jgi:pimeloyl-ACP methyl ester carboxylesterase
MATFLVAHGGWGGGWAWKKMRPLMASRGHDFFCPTLTGLGDRAHLAHRDIDLDTHIQDVVAVLEFEDLREVVLVGHSYGGMVATGVADRARDRVKHLVYVDAFVPENGKCTNDYYFRGDRYEAFLRTVVDGWMVPPQPVPDDTPAADAEWMAPRRKPHPLKSLEQKFFLRNGPLTLDRSYVYCRRHSSADPFRQFFEYAKNEGWPTYELDASHSPHVTAPEGLLHTLESVIR